MFEECRKVVKHQIVKIEEGRRKAIFPNPSKEEYEKIRIDNCVIKDGIRADFLLNKGSTCSVLIELKGSGVEHACDQLFASANDPNVKRLLTKRIGFLVICSKFPRFDTYVRKAKDRAAKSHKAGFNVCCDQGVFDIEKLVVISP